MKVFADTNVIMEMLEQRAQADIVGSAFDVMEEKGWAKFISAGSFYTLTYLAERILHKQGMARPELTVKLREILNGILDKFDVAAIGGEALGEGVNDDNFSDLEDSYQFQAAHESGCDVIVTLNVKDFPSANAYGISIVTPRQFYTKYCMDNGN